MSEKIFINTDGGSRGNPGPCGIGIVFFDEKGQEFHRHDEYIGEGTNNTAEYRAIIKALEILTKSKWFVENNSKENEVVCRLDSQLVVEQINGRYKVKQSHIAEYMEEIKKLLSQSIVRVSFVHIPREQNKIADRLVNKALDAKTVW
ncbi:MAG: ribonuclease HI family protein [Patescibacteria group bacterium]|jgi:ribonuclease HI